MLRVSLGDEKVSYDEGGRELGFGGKMTEIEWKWRLSGVALLG